MAKYLFDKKITPACKYCYYCKQSDGGLKCDKKGEVKPDDKCMRFKYDPTMREPELPVLPREYSQEDFKL